VYAHKNPFLNVLLRYTETLTFIHSFYLFDYQHFAKKLQKEAKKILKKWTAYQKNAYLCSVL